MEFPEKKLIYKNRPLYKFLDSSINIKQVSTLENSKKSDFITINDKKIRARDVRNVYEIIHYLVKKELNVDITEIINEDKLYMKKIMGIL